MNRFGSPLRWGLGLLVLGVLGVLALGTTMQIPWSSQSTSDLAGRTPATFAAACAELGAVLMEGDGTADGPSTCTTWDGHSVSSIRCDWVGQQCVAACEGTISAVDAVRLLGDGTRPAACEAVRDLAYVPLMQREATSSALTPATGKR
jgi:hypothetical protein